MKSKKIKEELQFPKQLEREDLFSCPIWYGDEPGFVNELNNASDKYIEASKKNLKESIDKRNKKFGNKGDMGHVFHSTSLIGDPKFKKLQDDYNRLTNEMGAIPDKTKDPVKVARILGEMANVIRQFADVKELFRPNLKLGKPSE